MLLTFYYLFCSVKLKESPFSTDDDFCTVHLRGYYINTCVSITCKSLKQSHMNTSPTTSEKCYFYTQNGT